MSDVSPYVRWYGRDEPPLQTRLLRAGPLTAILEGSDVRYVRVGGREVIRRLYVAVRDQNWGTIPGEIADLIVEERGNGFAVRFTVRHRQAAIDLVWQGEIVGTADGTLRYVMDGRAERGFRYNRIGLCLLHPPAESAGRPYTARTSAGSISGVLPERIGPQLVVDGEILALFPAFDELVVSPPGGGEVRFSFTGDLFEMEDQRNWTDDSFKTYSTPLALPWPKGAAPGQPFRQSVTMTTHGLAAGPAAVTGPPRLTLGAALGRPLPPVGLGLTRQAGPIAPGEMERLRALRPAHLRVDLHLASPDYPAELDHARQVATAVGCPLELALFVSIAAGTSEAELAGLAPRLAGLPVARVLVFPARGSGATVSTGGQVARVRAALAAVVGAVPFAGGSDVYFTDLNRIQPDPAGMDAIAYSINPQVHAFDETSLVETLLAQGETVRSAQVLGGDRPVVVGPVTLRPRFNPNATEAGATGGRLAAVDPRQAAVFGAAWTVGSLKALAEAGAASLTYYEASGPLGVLEASAVFPLYHILADAGAWRGGEVVACQSSEPLAVTALVVRTAAGLGLLVANLTPAEQTVTIEGLPDGPAALRRLTAESAPVALADPERFRATTEPAPIVAGRLTVPLVTYAVLRIDVPPRP